MKKNIILQIALCLNIASVAQIVDCNRNVWFKGDEKKIPKEVCILKGDYRITQVYERGDINDDGLEDFIFDWNKNPLEDGDTIYVTIYTQNPDSTFSHFRTFDNLYPIYFKRYDFDYIPKNEKLRKLHKKYFGHYPFLGITFEKGDITLTVHSDATTDYITTYSYDKSLKNWRYKKTIMYDFVSNTKENYDSSEQLGPLINNFTYFEVEGDQE